MDDVITRTRNDVLSTAQSIAADTGLFLTPSSTSSSDTDAERLNRIVTELEATSSLSSFAERERVLAIGDWKLVCTSTTFSKTSSSKRSRNRRLSSFPLPPFFPKLPTIQDAVRDSISVTQRIRTTATTTKDESNNNDTTINRVDNIIEYTPPTSLRDILPDAKVDININPLEVSGSKVTLVHDAEVESLIPVFRTRIGLTSVVLTIAGTSQYLDPDGSDIFGLNIPSLNDFSNSGTFDTTYVDEHIRISRGKAIQGSNGSGATGIGGETLRVFVRKEGSPLLWRDEVDTTVEEQKEEETVGVEDRSMEETVVETVVSSSLEDSVEVVIDTIDDAEVDGGMEEEKTNEEDEEVDVSDETTTPSPPGV